MRKPDEIMAEYLLKGGKMLAKTCSSCGSPLFECKGKTLCVVCQEEASALQIGKTDQVMEQKPLQGSEILKNTPDNQREIRGTLDEEFALTIGILLRQVREETDARRMKHLIQVVKTAAEAYSIISH